MSIGISLSIDVTKLDKAKFVAGKNGAKYLDLTCFINDQLDQYGNRGFITQSLSREEREQGVKGPILGNVKVFHGDSVSFIPKQSQQDYQPASTSAGPNYTDFDDDLDRSIPF